MSENLKLRIEQAQGEDRSQKVLRPTDPAAEIDNGPIDEAESQMRRALGLLGDGARHRSDPDRNEQPNRTGERFNGALHRRRFVQDGDVPVTVLRRDQGHEPPVHRGAAPSAPPTSSRLQRTEAALANETAARERLERSLAEAQAVAHDLQTKIGHAELSKNEALDALRRERDTVVRLRVEAQAREERLQEAVAQTRAAEQAAALCQNQLAEDSHARRVAEKALRASEMAREAAEQLVRALSEELPSPRSVESPRRIGAEPETGSFMSRRQRMAEVQAMEPEPVKWWLTAKPTPKRR